MKQRVLAQRNIFSKQRAKIIETEKGIVEL